MALHFQNDLEMCTVWIGNLQSEHWCVMSVRYLRGCITYAFTGVH